MAIVVTVIASGSPTTAWTLSTTKSSRLPVQLLAAADGRDGSNSGVDSEEDLVTSRHPHKLRDGRSTFLGFRSVSGFKRQASSTSSQLSASNDGTALMPDGGLSPCVIRVLGVGGGGCNAVRSGVLVFPFDERRALVSASDTTGSRGTNSDQSPLVFRLFKKPGNQDSQIS